MLKRERRRAAYKVVGWKTVVRFAHPSKLRPRMRQTTHDWGYRALLLLAWPAVVSRSAQAVVGFCDALMVAPLGEDALAAATAGSFNTLSVTLLPIGIVLIVQSYVAQLWGRGDSAGVRRYGWYGLLLAAFSGIAVLVAIPLVGPTVDRLQYTLNVRTQMIDYIAIRFTSVVPIVGIEALGNWYAGIGNTRYGMIANLAVMVLNVFLNWLLIEGHWGAPALGVSGAAIASVLASWLGFAILFVLFWTRTGFVVTEVTRLRSAEFLRMLRFGVPNGLNWFFEFAAFTMFINVIVAGLGTIPTAAMLAVMQVNAVSFMPAFGVASAGAILTGQAIGANRKDAVGSILRSTLVTAGTWQVSVGFVYLAAPAAIMSLFAPRGYADQLPAIVQVGALLLAISAAWQLFDAIGICVTEALRAAGDTSFCLWARLLVAWFLFVPASFVAVNIFDGGPPAAMTAVVGYLGVLALVLYLRFRSGVWRSIELTEDPIG